MEANINEELKRCLPYHDTPQEKAKRAQLWNQIDENANGYLSLAEVDKGLRDVIRIPQLFDAKPVIMRAFQSAKNRTTATNPHGKDYITKSEFRFLLSYIRQYYEYWIAFETVDKEGDRRISFQEFVKAVPTMKRWHLRIDNPEATFQEIDKNGGGYILFDEFCQWAIHSHLNVEGYEGEDLL